LQIKLPNLLNHFWDIDIWDVEINREGKINRSYSTTSIMRIYKNKHIKTKFNMFIA